MNVSVKLTVAIGEGADKRVFAVESHAYADPLHPYDAGWMHLGSPAGETSASAAVSKLAGELAAHVTDLVLAAEAGPAEPNGGPSWGGSGEPESVVR